MGVALCTIVLVKYGFSSVLNFVVNNEIYKTLLNQFTLLLLTPPPPTSCSLTTSDQKIIWANRLACISLLGPLPRGLPMVLMASKTSDSTLAETWKIIELWKMSHPIYGLELLDAQ